MHRTTCSLTVAVFLPSSPNFGTSTISHPSTVPKTHFCLWRKTTTFSGEQSSRQVWHSPHLALLCRSPNTRPVPRSIPERISLFPRRPDIEWSRKTHATTHRDKRVTVSLRSVSITGLTCVLKSSWCPWRIIALVYGLLFVSENVTPWRFA